MAALCALSTPTWLHTTQDTLKGWPTSMLSLIPQPSQLLKQQIFSTTSKTAHKMLILIKYKTASSLKDTFQHKPHDGMVSFNSSYVFWMGDLNFRLANHLASEEIIRFIENKDLEGLAKHDELTKARNSGDAFSMFSEGSLSFPPTYKYLEGCSDYDLK